MKEFKFRAWEKNLKEMIPIHNINFENNMVNTESAWRLFSEVELMQYTGLKDAYGTDIYEGDIISFISGGNYYQSKVFYDERSACYLVETPFVMLLDHAKKHVEVVGNIYEGVKN